MTYALNQGTTPPAQLPFLKAICWQIADVDCLAPEEMLRRYERGWTYRGVLADLGKDEAVFLRQLANRLGSWLAGHV